MKHPFAAQVVAVAEFCHAFDGYVLGKSRGKVKLKLSELDASVAALHCAVVPPLLERLCLSLLRVVCGRDPSTGEPEPGLALELEQFLFVGHMQNRRIWGHVLNALTWPDVARRHLLAERRYRDRLRDAFPSTLGLPAPALWVDPHTARAQAEEDRAKAREAAAAEAQAQARAARERLLAEARAAALLSLIHI